MKRPAALTLTGLPVVRPTGNIRFHLSWALSLIVLAGFPGFSDPEAVAAEPNIIIIFTDDLGLWRPRLLWFADDSHTAVGPDGGGGASLHRFLRGGGSLFAQPGSIAHRPLPDPQWNVRIATGSFSRIGRRPPPPGEITVAEVLLEMGYATAHVGKWHLGVHEGSRPQAARFLPGINASNPPAASI